MSSSADPASDDRLAEIRRRARRGWLRTLVVIAVVGGVVGGLTQLVDRHGAGAPRRHQTAGGSVIGLLVSVAVVLLAVAALVWGARRARRDKGFLAAPLLSGLLREERRAALRDIRHGTPSADPTVRIVERETAARMAAEAGRATVLFAALALLALVNAIVLSSSAANRVVDYVSAALLVALTILISIRRRNARRYLAAIERAA